MGEDLVMTLWRIYCASKLWRTLIYSSKNLGASADLRADGSLTLYEDILPFLPIYKAVKGIH